MKVSELITRINQYKYFPRRSKWIFVLLFTGLSAIYNYHNILFKTTQSLHQWRQCDCLSITMNYYQDNNPFLEPGVHNLGYDGTGKTISECPVIYYTVANLWKVFGHHEYIYRLLVLCLFFIGLFTVFRGLEARLQDSVVALFISMLLFTSPTLIFYANNYLMDIPAFSFALIGFHFFLKFEQTGKDGHFYKCAAFYTLAGLLKISALLSFMAIVGLFAMELLRIRLYSDRRLFVKPIRHALVIAGVFIIQMIWYRYALYYNTQYNSGNFLIGILPYWKMSETEIRDTFSAIGDHITWDYLRKETQVLLVLMLIFTLVFFRKINRTLLLLTIITAVGFLIFSVLFFGALKDHDYYTINLFILIPVTLLAFFSVLKERFNQIYNSFWLRLLLFAFLLHNADFARRRMSYRYKPDGWQNDYYSGYLKAFTEISPYLDSLGIRKDDKVLCLSDNSINITLYLMNRKGWTNYGIFSDSTKIRRAIDQGAEYLFISDSVTYSEPGIKPFIKDKIGHFRNIEIYKLNNNPETQP